VLDEGREGKVGGWPQAMGQRPIEIDTARNAARVRDGSAHGGILWFRDGKLFDSVTWGMAMMFVGQTLLIVALVNL
jgi:hypothetical protein